MPHVSSLPKRLRYLNPIRKHLAAFAPDELSEDMDPSLFQNAFRKRIAGLPLDQAKKILQGDQIELQRWLSQPGQNNDRLYFVYGFLVIASESLEKFLEAPSEQQIQDTISMEFPSEALTKKHYHGWKMRWRGFTLFVLPCDETSFESEIRGFHDPIGQYANLITVSVVPVHFGVVHGVKHLRTIAELGSKQIKYALKVPGGYATAAVMKKGLEWEESQLEQYFSTIQVIKDNENVA